MAYDDTTLVFRSNVLLDSDTVFMLLEAQEHNRRVGSNLQQGFFQNHCIDEKNTDMNFLYRNGYLEIRVRKKTSLKNDFLKELINLNVLIAVEMQRSKR